MPYSPYLREAVDIQLIKETSESIICLSCKLGVSQPLALISAIAPILVKLDGSLTLESLIEYFGSQGVDKDIIERVLQLLDEHYYLGTDRYFQKKQEMLEEFRVSEVRHPAHAGRIYSSDGDELNKYVARLLDFEGQMRPDDKSPLVALIAPHIDYNRGSSGYAKAYSQLVSQKPDICIVIGTSHQAGKSLFQLTRKDFASPNGTLLADKPFIDSLLAGYGSERGLVDELLHRKEHSLELQMPFLKYICPETKIVPILVGSFYPYLRRKQKPIEDSEYSDFLDILSDTIKQYEAKGSRVTIIAGVDMAHVGKNFGDTFLLESEKLSEIEKEDLIYLESIKALSSSDMFDHISKDYDQRRICGFPTLHFVLDVLATLGKEYRVDLCDYKQAVDQNSQCLVSFAALGIFEQAKDR